MNLLCRAKMILDAVGINAQTPFRVLTLVTSIGLLIGYGSFAHCATPAPAFFQDDDHQDEHDVHRHKLHSHSDGNIEVVVIKDDTQEGKADVDLHRHLLELLNEKKSGAVDHQVLIEKLKADGNVHLHKLLSDHDGDHGVVVIKGDVQKGDDNVKLHGHLVELLHGKKSGNIDHQELVEKLKANHKIHLHKLQSEHGGDHEVVVVKADAQEGDDDVKLHNHLLELLHGQKSGKVNHHELAAKLRQIADRLEAQNEDAHPKHEARRKIEILRKTGGPQQLIIESKAKNDEGVHSHDGDHAKVILHVKEDDARNNVFVEEIHGDREHDPHANTLHFGETSDEGLDQTIHEMKIELQHLRQKLNQLRSEPKKKKQSSSDNKKSKDFLWVERADSDKSANKFFLKKSKDKTGKSNPPVFRFNFKTREHEKN